MKENLKPTAENINKAKLEPIPSGITLDPFAETPMSKLIDEYVVIVEEKLDNAIFGVCNKILKDEGITHEYVLNKEFIVNAVKKQIPVKPVGEYTNYKCPVCGRRVRSGKGSSSRGVDHFCQRCGQKLDWSDTK